MKFLQGDNFNLLLPKLTLLSRVHTRSCRAVECFSKPWTVWHHT